MRLSGWDANDMVKHALTTLFEVSESQDYPPAIPDPCLALGKLIRASQSVESGKKPAPEQASGGKKKGLTFQPFSKDEGDDGLSPVIPVRPLYTPDVAAVSIRVVHAWRPYVKTTKD